MTLTLTCPAATEVSPPDHGPSVVCGVLREANKGEAIGGWTGRAQVSPLVSGREDARSITCFCSAAYADCPIWQAGREADDAGRKGPGAIRAEGVKRRELSPDAQEFSDELAELREREIAAAFR